MPSPSTTAVRALAIALSVLAIPLAAALLSSPATHLPPAGFYIAPAGDDADPCTLTSPCLTVPRAVGLAAPGDTVYARGGSYSILGEQWIVGTGDVGQPITITSYPGETALFSAAGANLTQFAPVLRIADSRHVVLDRVSVCCSTGRGISITASENITISRTTVTEIGDRAIGGHGDNITIEGNVIDRAVLLNEDRTASGGWGAGIASWSWPDDSPSRQWVVTGNTVTRTYGECYIALMVISFSFIGNVADGCFSVDLYVDRARDGIIAGNHLRATIPGFERNGRNAHGILFAAESSAVAITPGNVTVADNVIGPGVEVGIHWWEDPENLGTWNTYDNLVIVRNRFQSTDSFDAEFPPLTGGGDPPCCSRFSENLVSGISVFGDAGAWTVENNGPPRRPFWPAI